MSYVAQRVDLVSNNMVYTAAPPMLRRPPEGCRLMNVLPGMTMCAIVSVASLGAAL